MSCESPKANMDEQGGVGMPGSDASPSQLLQLDMEELQRLQEQFHTPNHVLVTLNMEEWLAAFSFKLATLSPARQQTYKHDLTLLFQKIDESCKDEITWDAFTGFMLRHLPVGGSEMGADVDGGDFATVVKTEGPAGGVASPEREQHSDFINKILVISDKDASTQATSSEAASSGGRPPVAAGNRFAARYVTAGRDGTLRVWSPTFQLLRRTSLGSHRRWFTDICWLRRSQRLCAAAADFTLFFLDGNVERCIGKIETGVATPTCLAYTDSGLACASHQEILMVGDGHGVVTLYTLDTLAAADQSSTGHTLPELRSFNSSASLHGSGSRATSPSRDMADHAKDLPPVPLPQKSGSRDSYDAASAAAGASGQPRDVEHDSRRMKGGASGAVLNTGALGAGRSYSDQRAAGLVTVEQILHTPRPIRPLPHICKTRYHDNWVTKVGFVPDLQSMVTSGLDGIINIGDIQTNKRKRDPIRLHRRGVYCWQWCSTFQLFASGGQDREILIWNPYTVKPLNFLHGHSAPIKHLLLNEPCFQLISASSDKVVKVWDIRNFRCMQTLTMKDSDDTHPMVDGGLDATGDEGFTSIALHCGYEREGQDTAGGAAGSAGSETRLLLTDRKVHCWPLSVPTEHFKSHRRPVVKALYNANFQQAVSGDISGTVRVWDLKTGALLLQFHQAHGKDKLTSMCFDSTERRLLTASDNGTVILWNFSSGQAIRTFALHEQHPTELTELRVFCETPQQRDEDAQPTHTHQQQQQPVARKNSGESSSSSREPRQPAPSPAPPALMRRRRSSRGKEMSELVVGVGVDKRIYVWPHSKREKITVQMVLDDPTNDAEGDMTSFCCCPAYQSLVSADSDGFIYIWKIQEYHEQTRPLKFRLRDTVMRGMSSSMPIPPSPRTVGFSSTSTPFNPRTSSIAETNPRTSLAADTNARSSLMSYTDTRASRVSRKSEQPQVATYLPQIGGKGPPTGSLPGYKRLSVVSHLPTLPPSHSGTVSPSMLSPRAAGSGIQREQRLSVFSTAGLGEGEDRTEGFLEGLKQLHAPAGGYAHRVDQVIFLETKQVLASIHADGYLRLWSVAKGELLSRTKMPFSPSGEDRQQEMGAGAVDERTTTRKTTILSPVSSGGEVGRKHGSMPVNQHTLPSAPTDTARPSAASLLKRHTGRRVSKKKAPRIEISSPRYHNIAPDSQRTDQPASPDGQIATGGQQQMSVAASADRVRLTCVDTNRGNTVLLGGSARGEVCIWDISRLEGLGSVVTPSQAAAAATMSFITPRNMLLKAAAHGVVMMKRGGGEDATAAPQPPAGASQHDKEREAETGSARASTAGGGPRKRGHSKLGALMMQAASMARADAMGRAEPITLTARTTLHDDAVRSVCLIEGGVSPQPMTLSCSATAIVLSTIDGTRVGIFSEQASSRWALWQPDTYLDTRLEQQRREQELAAKRGRKRTGDDEQAPLGEQETATKEHERPPLPQMPRRSAAARGGDGEGGDDAEDGGAPREPGMQVRFTPPWKKERTSQSKQKSPRKQRTVQKREWRYVPLTTGGVQTGRLSVDRSAPMHAGHSYGQMACSRVFSAFSMDSARPNMRLNENLKQVYPNARVTSFIDSGAANAAALDSSLVVLGDERHHLMHSRGAGGGAGGGGGKVDDPTGRDRYGSGAAQMTVQVEDVVRGVRKWITQTT
ncbi:unnamed protein product [Vitrella brassicaformis CCMP3155]|uniref:Guanine nucleotide-binding protein subunit beta-like protein n=3 Tax=Vitrella brassicaformis TaxID=1169539 RepID=A0A0G4GB58_VITBC|nr:unnamed protein product [Vitrella brassicaformis CCMP3155]|eukprot:CEM26365.1 unnamed protein product [Vitrella brassicaformis CCMP3155]